jgi:hypothetical protein
MKAEYITVTFLIKQTKTPLVSLFIVAAPSAVRAHMFLVETLRKSKPLFAAV